MNVWEDKMEDDSKDSKRVNLHGNSLELFLREKSSKKIDDFQIGMRDAKAKMLHDLEEEKKRLDKETETLKKDLRKK